jgi:hypothetical protein
MEERGRADGLTMAGRVAAAGGTRRTAETEWRIGRWGRVPERRDGDCCAREVSEAGLRPRVVGFC